MIRRAMEARAARILCVYPLGEAVAVRRLAAPGADMDVVLGRLGGLRRAVLPLLLAAAILAVALRGLPLAGILLGGRIALLRRFATLAAGILLQNAREMKSFGPRMVRRGHGERNSARTLAAEVDMGLSLPLPFPEAFRFRALPSEAPLGGISAPPGAGSDTDDSSRVFPSSISFDAPAAPASGRPNCAGPAPP